MDVGDVTDPNLDGDFQTLVEVRQKRNRKEKNDDAIKQLLSLETVRQVDGTNLAAEKSTAKSATPSNGQLGHVGPGATDKFSTGVDAEPVRKQLLEAVAANSVSALQAACKKVEGIDLTLTHQALRDPSNNATILHTALEGEKWDVAKHLIQSSSDETILEDVFTVTVRKITSEKTCLHLLAEKGNCDLTKLLLEQITNPARRERLLSAAVLTELEGQRPRHLAGIHLASLRGYTALVELFLDYNVSVNCTNNKNDTPVLWAARGNHMGTVRLLISRGADLQLENDKGSTPLYWAVRYGFADLVRLLVVEGNANIHQRRKLGLVTPIVLASALGHSEIVAVLLEHGADPNARIGNDTTPLQAAAAEGNDEVVKLLLTKGQAAVDQVDTAGNTALLSAAKAGNIATMKLLVENGASIDYQNKIGETIWHYAIRQDDDTLLRAIVGLYRQAKHLEDSKVVTFAAGRSPLQVAVAAGRVDKIKRLLELGVDARATDLNGNTYYHLAARVGKMEVLKAFVDDVDMTAVNNDGDTALHLAANSGHVETVKLLLQKSKLDARNKAGMTPLHEAVGSDAAQPEMIRTLVDVIVKANNWSLVDAVDKHGNTALHVAARRARPDILPELAALNARAKNRDGETPFHVAARAGLPHNVETMLTVFNRPEKGFNIDETTTNDVESALHICARRGDWQRVELLVHSGANLAQQNKSGNTPLHVVVEESLNEPSMIEDYLQVLRVVIRCSTRWWCMKNELPMPNDESELYYVQLRSAMLNLTSDIFNSRGLSVVGMAAAGGAVQIIEELLNTSNVYRFREGDEILYDITYLTPYTTPTLFSNNRNNNASRKSASGSKKSSAVGVMPAVDEAIELTKTVAEVGQRAVVATTATVIGPVSESCLELIVSMPDEILAARMLDVNPIRQLVQNMWTRYQWMYVFLMLVHITYMVVYTVYALPYYSSLSKVYNSSYGYSTSCGYSYPNSPDLYGLFLIWPAAIVIFTLYYTITSLVRYCAKIKCCGRRSNRQDGDDSNCCSTFNFVNLPGQIVTALFGYLPELSAFTFCGLVAAWYALYRCGTTSQAYVQTSALVMIFGWLYTLQFTKGFETMHAFSIMLKYIIIRDITRFLFMYVFVLIGFGLAFFALFQLGSVESSNSGPPLYVLFTMFNLMVGLGSPLSSDFETTYRSEGGDPPFAYWVYIFYIGVASIIMMNLLVAMMSDTYSSVKSKEGTTWKVGSLQLALRIERSMPFVKKVVTSCGCCSKRDPITYDAVAGRWMMSVPSSEVSSRLRGDAADASKDELVEAMMKIVQRLETKVDRIQTAHAELVQQVDVVSEAIKRGAAVSGPDAAAAGVASVRRPPPASLFNVAMMLRGRPKSAVKPSGRR